MDLRQLRYFKAVAEERNFIRAAERLHISQPPLSRAIQQLEEDVGVPLLDRSTRPLTLTDPGRMFLEQAVQILARMESLETMMSAAVMKRKRRFAIGYVASTIYARLPPLIRGFRKAAPNVELSLVELVSLEQIAAVKEGRIDVGFGRIRFDDPAVQRTVLREEKLVVALPANHALSVQEGTIAMHQLRDEPLIVYPSNTRPSFADQVLEMFADHSLRPVLAHEARELQIAIGLVAAEEGVCIVPDSVRKSRVDDVVYRELAGDVGSPIIMSHRVGDRSEELAIMSRVIAEHYAEWGYPVPDAMNEFDR